MYENLIDGYLSALTGDIKEKGGRTDRLFDTVYIGGGTPSLLGGKVGGLLRAVTDNFNISKNAEITAEVNPDVSDEFLKIAFESGVNRISVGIQSGNDEALKVLGRNHTKAEAENAVERIKKAGFNNISADLMICLPNSNLNTLSKDIDFILSLDIPHISAYILKIEDFTKFGKTPVLLPDDDAQAEQYLYFCKELENQGYSHYEISNFCKPGFESRHNLKYWNCEEYLGFGPSAHSFFEGKRFFYPNDIKAYISNPTTLFDGIGGDESEKIILGLRLKKGIDLSGILCDNKEDNIAFLSRLQSEKLININGTSVSLTDKGMLLSNSVITEILELL